MTLPIMTDAKSSASRLSDLATTTAARSSQNPTPTSLTTAQLVVPHGKLNTKLSDPNIGDGAKPRRSSPESDAVVSSDEELDQSKLGYFPNNKLNGISQFSSRRPSYAAEFHTRQRTYSITGDGGALSPTTSHPTTPSGDPTAWVPGATAKPSGIPTTGAGIGALWSPSIWNNEPARKSPSKTLTMGGTNTSSLFSGSEALPSPTSMPNGSEFPIPIPLQPTYRNHRSMSFSVGQMELDQQNRQRRSPPSHVGAQRAHAGLQHRPSRPSLLSEEQFPGPSSPLRIVNESEDDELKELGQPQTASGSYFPTQVNAFPRTKFSGAAFRNRSASAATIPSMGLGSVNGLGASGLGGNGTIDEYESAVAEEDDWDLAQFQAEQRRFSEAAPRAMSFMYSPTENQRLEALRRQNWASVSGGFVLPEGSQSRRHSFAGPMADASEADLGLPAEYLAKRATNMGENGSGLNGRGNNYLSLTDVSNFDTARKDPLYINEENRLRTRQSFTSAQPPTLQQASSMGPNHHLPSMGGYVERHSPPSAAQRAMMGIPMHPQPRGQQLLYFVTFKACRGDVFYVQEGTGLRVKTGDLVIVEADRGTDLGTVAYENITWAKAKELKEQFAKEQYNVLMMYASRRTTAGAPNSAASSTMNANGGPPGFMSGNSGPAHGHHTQGQDSSTAELKPKMIKRLALGHEIQTLRDKEANEAKAKRVCQQKVLEHRLPMEILDAEFQMDWKKLTFYYFAENYINFNSLVTDLFKVYKTRIWMSAMNPASFAHGPGSGPHPGGHPSGLSTIGEASKDSTPQQFVGLNPNYNGFAAPASSGIGVGGAGVPRGFSQPMPPHGGIPTTMASFPSRHSPQSVEPQFALNSYGGNFGAGAPGFSVPGMILGGDPLAPNGVDQTWMGLQGLSLNSN